MKTVSYKQCILFAPILSCFLRCEKGFLNLGLFRKGAILNNRAYQRGGRIG